MLGEQKRVLLERLIKQTLEDTIQECGPRMGLRDLKYMKEDLLLFS